jgi:hypothetical protein
MSSVVKTFRTITSFTTLILLIFLIRHYYIRLKFEKFKQKVEISDTLYSTGLIWKLIFELLLCAIHTPPFLQNLNLSFYSDNGTLNKVDIDLFISSAIPLRVYLVFRYYTFYSSWADDRAEKICNDCNTLGGISFAIKAELKERPYTVVGVLMLMSILIFGHALRNVEVCFMQNKSADKFQDWSYVWNGFWCIIITILTIGYGDFYPQTVVGRCIAVVAVLWGTFLISLMVVSLTISVEFTPQEQKAYDELKKGEMYFNLKRKALQTLRYGVKLKSFPENRADINDTETKIKYIRTLDHFKHNLNEFRNARKFIVNKEHEQSAENILYQLNENVNEEMENLINLSSQQVSTLIDYLNLSQNIQSEIKSYVMKLDNMTKGLSDCLD